MKSNLVKIIATLGLIVVIAVILKSVFGIGKIGFENLLGRKICEKVKFTEKKYTGKLHKHFRAPSGETAATYCRNSNSWADIGCELTPKYKRDHKDLINHLQYYMWLTIKLKKRDNPNQTLMHTIKEFDYYRPKPNYLK